MIRMRGVMTVALLAAAVAVGPAGASEFHRLDPSAGFLYGISNNGVAAGEFYNVYEQYVMWTAAAGVVPIGGVPAGYGVGGQARVSNDGLYICGTTYNAAEDYHEMSRYDVTAGTWTGFGAIPDIGYQVDAEVSSGWGISGDGMTVVGLGWTSLGTVDTHAFQWTEGVGPIDLGSAEVGESARANAADYDGNVVAGWQDGNGRQGAAWVDGVEELIFTDGGSPAWEAFDVSDDGEWVVGLGIGGFWDPGYAYRYNVNTDTYESLPNLAVGAARYMAGAGVNADGSIIVGGTWGFGPATWGKGFIWQECVGTMPFADYLDMHGVEYPAGYKFNFIADVSPDGQWFVGWGGFNPMGASETFVVHVSPDAAMDIQPRTCPNELDLSDRWSIHVALLGTENYDITEVNLSTLRLEGVEPFYIAASYVDHSRPVDHPECCECTEEGRDGYDDIYLKFDTIEVLQAMGGAVSYQPYLLRLTGELDDGTPITAFDCMTFINPPFQGAAPEITEYTFGVDTGKEDPK